MSDDITSTLQIYEIVDDQIVPLTHVFARESSVSIFVADRRLSTHVISPAMLEAYAVGHLACKGIITSADEIREVRVEGATVRCFLHDQPDKARVPEPSPPRKLSAAVIHDAVRVLDHYSKVYRKTAGVHVAVVLDEDATPLTTAEDIGRRTAAEKAIGQALLDGAHLDDLMLVLSCRLPAGLVRMIARAGIRTLISVAYPTADGVLAAREAGITLITVRNGRILLHAPHADTPGP